MAWTKNGDVLADRSILQVAIAYQRVLADAMPVLVMMADPDGTVNFFNRAWYEYTGQAVFERDVDGDWRRYLHPDDTERVANDWIAGVSSDSDVIDMEYRLREASTGTYRWVKARATGVRDATGEIIQWIGTAMDVDEARRTNNALIEIAEAYQAASLPYLERSFNGLEFSVAYRASTRHLTACGDWYDAFPLDGGRTAICIGDVSGHGLHASTLMAKYRQSVRAIALRAARRDRGGADSILRSVEEAIALEHPDANATAFFAIVDADRNVLRWANAGHPPPLVLRADGSTAWIAGDEPPLGWRFGLKRTAHTTSLKDARALVLYTDGLVEASRNLIEGMSQLGQHVRDGMSAGDLALHILESWTPAPVQDDVAILAIRF